MFYAILSILILTLLVWGINKKLPIQVCSICAGVTLTWAWLLGGMWLGYLPPSRYEFIVAILMGATIGGIVTELKKVLLKIKNKKNKKVGLLEDKLKDCC